jgi:hypothetical protein
MPIRWHAAHLSVKHRLPKQSCAVLTARAVATVGLVVVAVVFPGLRHVLGHLAATYLV